MHSLRGHLLAPRRSWLIGGALLLATVPLRVMAYRGASPIAGHVVGTVVFSAALLVFAWGFRSADSVTARRPLGTAALLLLALWLLLGSAVSDVISEAYPNDLPPAVFALFGGLDPFVQFALALVAAIQIARAGVVPAPWRFAPCWTLAAVAVPSLVTQIVVTGATQQTAIAAYTLINAVDGSIRIASTIVLGVVAVVLADRARVTPSVPLRAGSAEPHRTTR